MCQRELQVCFISEDFLEITSCFLFYPLPLDAQVVTCAATFLFASLPGYSGSEDCVAMETLLQGYDEQDEDQVYRVCNSPLLKYMDNDVSCFAMWFQLDLECVFFGHWWQSHMMRPKKAFLKKCAILFIKLAYMLYQCNQNIVAICYTVYQLFIWIKFLNH